MSIKDAIKAFSAAVRADRAANPGIAGDGVALELLIAPHFKTLLEAILPEVAAMPPAVLPEYARRGVGRPDIAFAQTASPARAFIELKEPNKPLDPSLSRGHDADQFARFSELPIWGLSNFCGIRLYQRGELVDVAEIAPPEALEPTTSAAAAERLIDTIDHEALSRIIQTLATAQPYVPHDPEEVALVLAHAARLVRSGRGGTMSGRSWSRRG
jgi:hypothetical protein